MKKIDKLLGLGFLTALVIASCTKIAPVPMPTIDLGVESKATGIKSVSVSNNIVMAVFLTTPGAKYSIQIVPFGSDEPVKKEGFTATDSTTRKVLNLSDLSKKDYDLIFIDITGNEAKYPVIVK